MVRIKTDYRPKPIPPRDFDWMAWLDDQEESGPYGYGPTEEAAIEDLLIELESRSELNG